MIFTSVPVRMPAPTAPSARRSRPWRRDPGRQPEVASPTPAPARRPARSPGGQASVDRAGRAARPGVGSSRARNVLSTAGRPRRREYIALWPAAQMLRRIGARIGDAGQQRRDEVGQLDPARRRVEDVGRRPSGSARSSTRTTPTSRCRRSAPGSCGRVLRARVSVIAAASAAAVWSFHSQACAARLLRERGSSASGRAWRVDRQRRRAGRVDADADHPVAREAAGVADRPRRPARRSPTRAARSM